MSLKKWLLVGSISFLSMASYGQRGLPRAVDAAVQHQVFSRAQLPTVRDGVRNLVTGRLGAYQMLVPAEIHYGVTQNFPVRSTFNFKAGELPKQQVARITEFPRIVGGRHDARPDGSVCRLTLMI